jgi:hypothetical protein
VRAQFPSHEPYRAWSNFEFIADDGSINEVDLLVFTPQGFFLIEIKSRPGRLFGEGLGYQDWQATHVQFPDAKRRVRLYLVRAEASARGPAR